MAVQPEHGADHLQSIILAQEKIWEISYDFAIVPYRHSPVVLGGRVGFNHQLVAIPATHFYLGDGQGFPVGILTREAQPMTTLTQCLTVLRDNV